MASSGSFDQCRFADCLIKYEAIWNVRSKYHGNKTRRRAEMSALASEMGITVELAELKYNSLRTYFVKQRRKVKESERLVSGVGTVFRPSWPPYSRLLFLEQTLDDGNSDVATNSGGAEDLGLVTMVDNPRMPDSLTMQHDSLSTVSEINTDVIATPEVSGGLRSSLHAGSVHSPIRIDDEIQDGVVDMENYQENIPKSDLLDIEKLQEDIPKSDLQIEQARRHSRGSHSPISARPIFPPTNLSSPPHSVSTFCFQDTTVSCNAAHSPGLTVSTPVAPLPKTRKRSFPSSNESQLGSVLQDIIDNLRTITDSLQQDTSDDVSGFLKMIGYQLRSIEDPLRRMRVMHAIQGVILEEIASTVT